MKTQTRNSGSKANNGRFVQTFKLGWKMTKHQLEAGRLVWESAAFDGSIPTEADKGDVRSIRERHPKFAFKRADKLTNDEAMRVFQQWIATPTGAAFAAQAVENISE
ncbi:MAG TPA: hypothetical protein VGG34_01255 [Opitutaceae bacterium]|jgi:hypothetical protein